MSDSESGFSEFEGEAWAAEGDEQPGNDSDEDDGVAERIAAVVEDRRIAAIEVFDTTNYTPNGNRRTVAVAVRISLLKEQMGIGQFTTYET